jgi:hypothetical protein
MIEKSQVQKWVMGTTFLIAALILSSNVSWSKYGYLLFALGHVMGTLIFLRDRDHAMFWHNLVFLTIDAWGVYRWFV